jgi:hypothetical protein
MEAFFGRQGGVISRVPKKQLSLDAKEFSNVPALSASVCPR